jgi:hypothetical protein
MHYKLKTALLNNGYFGVRIEGVWEQGAEEIIWTRRLENIAK